MRETQYDYSFYEKRDEETRYSASIILDILKEYIDISSVVDVGGGVGTWLSVIQEKNGCSDKDIMLIEGDYVEKSLLQVKEESYISCNLERRIKFERKFNLAISLEVAEHLSVKRAASFCEDLTFLSDVVLFSAAVPYQGGTGHVNEQPLSYWVKLFSKYNYVALDIIRPVIQFDKSIPFWYRQNVIVFVKKDSAEYTKFLSKREILPPLDMISYDVYMNIENRIHSLFIYKIYNFMRNLHLIR